MPASSPHRYTHPATPPELEPGAGVIDGTRAEAILAGYGLTIGQAVEVELLVAGGPATGRLLEGTVADATDLVLVIEPKGHRRPTRVPFTAVALIRDAYTDHPGL